MQKLFAEISFKNKLKVTIPNILCTNTLSLLLATSASCGQICQFVTICVTAKCPLTAFEINSLLILLHYILLCRSLYFLISPIQTKVGIVSEWNSSRSIFDIFKIHQNLNADINPWMMTCIWQRGNRRLAQIYTVGAAKASRKMTKFGQWIYAEEIVKHSFLWMQHQNFSDSIKEKLSNSDITLRTCKRKFV